MIINDSRPCLAGCLILYLIMWEVAPARRSQNCSELLRLGLFLTPSEQFWHLIAEATSHIYNEFPWPSLAVKMGDSFCGQFKGQLFGGGGHNTAGLEKTDYPIVRDK